METEIHLPGGTVKTCGTLVDAMETIDDYLIHEWRMKENVKLRVKIEKIMRIS